jgi:hypothetical protein
VRHLDRLIPTPRLCELDQVEIAASPAEVWQATRHRDLAMSPFVRALFALRALPARLSGREPESGSIRIDDLTSTVERPGFQLLADDPPHEVAVGAIGKVWQAEIPFEHVANQASYSDFSRSGFIKVAWALAVEPFGADGSRLSIEVRVDATDDDSWAKFVRYFRLIGPFSRLIRTSTLKAIARELGSPAAKLDERPLGGDELLPDSIAQLTHAITIAAAPEKIWPWLVQMGCDRAGFYSVDLFDNDGVRSAREIHPEWQRIAVGDDVVATPDGSAAFEVLRVDAPRSLVLGGLFDPTQQRRLPFAASRPRHFWHVTWSFILEPLDVTSTRVYARARAAYSPSETLHGWLVRPVHSMMETAQLRNLRARVEGTLRRDDGRDVLDGLGGAARICLALVSPWREARSHHGLDPETAARTLPGDELVRDPRWSWTHGIEIDASASQVWPWITQIGATKAGFYSYQWLENLAGCELENAEVIHPEWETKLGDDLFLHPSMAPLKVVKVDRGSCLVAYCAPDRASQAAGEPWVAASWLFFVEALSPRRCRLVSRYRVAYSDDLVTTLSLGRSLLEPIGFAMDRRMLIGVKTRAEARSSQPTLPRS